MTQSASPFDPQLAAAYRLAAEIQELLGPPGDGVAGVREHAQRARSWWNEGGPRMAGELELSIPVRERQVRAVAYVPLKGGKPLPASVYLHGGAFRFGEPRSNDRMLRDLASAWGGIVVSLDYVHVPEQVFPAAVEDTAAALQWLSAHGAQFGIDGGRLAFGGTSAGANIAMGAAVQLQGKQSGFLRAGAMVVGVFDQDFESESMRQYAGPGFFPTQAGARGTIEQYVPDPALRNDPRVHIVQAELREMPPLFLAAAQLDVYRDSSRKLAAALEAARVPCRLVEYEGMGHLFAGYSRLVDRARRCIGDIAEFLRRELPA
jgi:acetyl esterase